MSLTVRNVIHGFLVITWLLLPTIFVIGALFGLTVFLVCMVSYLVVAFALLLVGLLKLQRKTP